nr:hypothetical protein [Haliscomenobacter sp.]
MARFLFPVTIRTLMIPAYATFGGKNPRRNTAFADGQSGLVH